jgi:hypothetical protein
MPYMNNTDPYTKNQYKVSSYVYHVDRFLRKRKTYLNIYINGPHDDRFACGTRIGSPLWKETIEYDSTNEEDFKQKSNESRKRAENFIKHAIAVRNYDIKKFKEEQMEENRIKKLSKNN